MTWPTSKEFCESCGAERPCERCRGVPVKAAEILEYEKEDYLLINRFGQVVAVSGNTDFDSYPEEYIILKVVEKAEK